MGLDCSHDAFTGSYGAFDRFRKAVVEAMGGSWPPHEKTHPDTGEKLDDNMWYWGDGYSRKTHPGLFIFLSHSDCAGSISPDACRMVADELEELLPKLDIMGQGTGHIAAQGGYGAVCRKFIAGCRLAASRNEDLEFC